MHTPTMVLLIPVSMSCTFEETNGLCMHRCLLLVCLTRYLHSMCLLVKLITYNYQWEAVEQSPTQLLLMSMTSLMIGVHQNDSLQKIIDCYRCM